MTMNDEANLLHIVGFSLIGGVFSLIGGFVLLSSKKAMNALHAYATPFAAGALLATVFIDLVPEGIEESDASRVLIFVLLGLLSFFLLERLTHWFHHHHGEGDDARKNVPLIILGDTLHNALDGVVIASAFLISVPTGIVATIAVAAHEIPQEIADFGLLLARGLSRKKVILVNILSALSTVVAAVVVFSLGDSDTLPIGALLGLSAGFLLYIAASDILPSIHDHAPNKKLFDVQALLVLLGVGLVWVSVAISHQYIHNDHAHGPEESACIQYLDENEEAIHAEDCHSEDHND